MSAWARCATTAKYDPPAQAISHATSTARPPARAIARPAPNRDAPARAIERTIPNTGRARAGGTGGSVNLDDAIREATNDLAITDPHEAARHIIDSHSASWLGRELRDYAESFIAQRIRIQYHVRRTSASGGEAAESWKDVHGPGIFVDTVGWKRVADLTEADCRLIAADYRSQSAALAKRADYFERLADAIAASGVAVVGELSGDGVLA